jgi:hypothetical protein
MVMDLRLVAAFLLVSAVPLRAAPVQPSKIALAAEERLHSWLAADPKVQEKISRAQAPAPFPIEDDLKDSVADQPSGPKDPQPAECQNLQGCATPPLAVDVPAGEAVEPAIHAMMRPWILLADAKGVRLGIARGSDSEALLAMNIQGLGLSGVGLNIAPRPEGGVHLWFSRGLELAALYSRERDSASRP